MKGDIDRYRIAEGSHRLFLFSYFFSLFFFLGGGVVREWFREDKEEEISMISLFIFFIFSYRL